MMASQERDRLKDWQDLWDEGSIDFHRTEVHPMLTKYFDKLISSGTTGRVFVPLCGKSVDMKWLADKGVGVVGLDAVRISLEQFFSEQNLEYTVEKAPQLGNDCEVFKSIDDKIHLYCGDMMSFGPDVSGQFEAVWDRGSIVALDREDVPTYAGIIKSLLKPGGNCLVEVVDYDLKILEEFKDSLRGIPPPFAMCEPELKQLYEPECKVELLERVANKLMDIDIFTQIFLLSKQ